MSLEELWQLFPIRLTPHAPRWKTQYTKEAQSIFTILSTLPIFRISHIGSTAVPEIHAKPIVDILLEIPKQSALTDYKNILTAHDWICMSENEKRISFNKGYTPEGYAEEVYHLHLCFQGDNDELYFRDFLIDHSETAKEYERLNQMLKKEKSTSEKKAEEKPTEDSKPDDGKKE